MHDFRLAGDIARALTHHEGELDELSPLARAVERRQVEKFEDELERRDLDLDELARIEHDAYAWTHGRMD